MKTELSKDSIVQIARISELPGIEKQIKSNVKIYEITYKTKNFDGTDIVASGIVLIPDVSQAASMVSIQHGTALSDQDVPTTFAAYAEPALVGPLFAGQGYITVMADYIGYGSSKAVPHPYEHRASLGSSGLDMLRAARELVRQKQVNWDNKLYLTGYSEGGYATMSLQKKIEEEAMSEFSLKASSCGAGAYDKTSFMKFLINEPTAGVAQANVLYLWVLLSYDKIYHLNRPMSAYFKMPYAQQIEKLGLGYEHNESFDKMLTDDFRKGLNDGSDKAFLDAIADNNVYKWKSSVPTRLFHGDADPLVFYFNSQNAEKAMNEQGSKDVKLVTIKDGDHNSSWGEYLEGTAAFFTQRK